MAANKSKSIFFCNECGYESSKWLGQCPGCRQWNTMVEEVVPTFSSGKNKKYGFNVSAGRSQGPVSIQSVKKDEATRIGTGFSELDRVLGGGIVRGSLTLVGGDPGIGKSTLLLQMCCNLMKNGFDVMYISGEESLSQIKLRYDRLLTREDIKPSGDNAGEGSLKLYCETSLQDIQNVLEAEKPGVVIIDSIQTMYSGDITSAPGSVSQVREATGLLLRLAKQLDFSIFIVGHVTKEGTVAGPRVLEHMVDTVLYFEGDRFASYRVLRGVKNRFGSTDEIGVFEMRESGLTQVENASEFLISGKPDGATGSVVACSMEGTRPILLEIQALVCQTNFGFPKRQANGTDLNRLNLLMAVLEKRVGMQLGGFDAYVNLAGGMRINEPGLDLGMVMAIASSFKNRPVSDEMLIFGEVGLSGEVRAVSQALQRVKEASKLGFKTCILPYRNLQAILKDRGDDHGIKLIGVSSVADAIEYI